ncbi:MAG TPA: serine/threonine-protein kinase [Candidatus Limnocylindria bacterium]|nr:serine/threonine-protein kinase [Candidatus Limnocylindria bacterium]
MLDPLGSGGSSQVYLAHDSQLGREVAIKVLDDSASAQEDLKRLFAKEGRALAQLSHPNIVAVHDVGEVDGRPYIVMERVEAASLKQRIERTGPLPVGDAIRLAVEVAAGLEAAHARGIIHADLKPSNVLLDRDDHAKICDFGIARTPQEDAETPQLYATALYVAPERVEGKRASVASDIYGLGLVLYEMLVGRPPFTSANAAVLLRDHVVRQPVPPSHLRPSLPRELDSIVLKALAKDPALRYRKASEFAAALAKIVPESSTAFGATRFVTEPIADFVPEAAQSPVVHLLSTYGGIIRNVFFGLLAALPVFGLVLLSGFDVLLALGLAGIVAAIAFLGQLGIALGIAWVVETALILLFVPGLAVLFALMGVFAWLREVKAEQAALALAMPVSAPFGLAPALALSSVAIHGLSGVLTVAWGALLTLIFAVASGRQSFGPFAQTGLTLQQDSLFSAIDAAESRSALLSVFNPPQGHSPWEAIGAQLGPEKLASEMGNLVSRLAAADVTALANVLAWVVAALAVWAVTRLLRSLFDALLRHRAWFALYVFATAIGVTSGALLLYMIFVTVSPLASAPGRIADDVLFLSALTGAVLAIAVGVVISATEPHEHEEEQGPAMAGRRIAVR